MKKIKNLNFARLPKKHWINVAQDGWEKANLRVIRWLGSNTFMKIILFLTFQKPNKYDYMDYSPLEASLLLSNKK